MFKADAFFNPYVAAGAKRLDAVISLTYTSDAVRSSAAMPILVGFLVDDSGSMTGDKLTEAKRAVRKGIEMLPETASFFVIAFNEFAKLVVRVGQATAENKASAIRSIEGIKAAGSTGISTALALAREQVMNFGACVACMYLQTDGDNGDADKDRLPQVLESCKGIFQCEARGIGTDWKPAELRTIASALLGTADAITDPAGLEADYADFLSRTLSKSAANAVMRLRMPGVVKLATLRQMSPDILDLMPLGRKIDDRTFEVPLGAWGDESRDYQIAFELPPNAVGDKILLCRSTVVVPGAGTGGDAIAECPSIVAEWSDSEEQTARISKEVAHYTGQSELSNAISDGLKAKAEGNVDEATRLLGRAVQLAASSGNDEVTRRLQKVVDVQDAQAGTVRLKRSDKAADMDLEMGGTRTVRRRAAAPSA